MKKIALITSTLFVLPLVSFAAEYSGANVPAGLQPIVAIVSTLGWALNALIPILIAGAVVVFFWGLITYIRAPGGKGANRGRDIMIAGLASLFVMVSVWGIVRLGQGILGIEGKTGAIEAPQIK